MGIEHSPRVFVVGSINMDIVTRVERHPAPGETVHGLETTYASGGKGANQAAGAARSGSRVIMVGGVGRDGHGQELLDGLAKHGVDVVRVQVFDGGSGTAFIAVASSGENTIILSRGANGRLSTDAVKDALRDAGKGDLILLQNEIPWETTLSAVQMGWEAGAKVILNPAPARDVSDHVLKRIDTLVVNEHEAGVVWGRTVRSRSDAAACAQALVSRGSRAVILTMGEQGVVYADQSGESHVMDALPTKVVDTTAAGDTFIGAYATAAAQGADVSTRLRFALAAAAIAVSRLGAQPSIPSRGEIETFLRSLDRA